MLTLLCITRYGGHADPFLSAFDSLASELACDYVEVDGTGAGAIENVLDDAVAQCADGWILRLDDDELPSQSMVHWLQRGGYDTADHWAFPRLNLWGDDQHFIASPPLYPDLQTRLSVKEKSGGRHRIHDGSPYGTGEVALCQIEHYKFLVRSRQEREALLHEYELLTHGAALWGVFSVPESFPGWRVEEREGRPIPLHSGKE